MNAPLAQWTHMVWRITRDAVVLYLGVLLVIIAFRRGTHLSYRGRPVDLGNKLRLIFLDDQGIGLFVNCTGTRSDFHTYPIDPPLTIGCATPPQASRAEMQIMGYPDTRVFLDPRGAYVGSLTMIYDKEVEVGLFYRLAETDLVSAFFVHTAVIEDGFSYHLPGAQSFVNVKTTSDWGLALGTVFVVLLYLVATSAAISKARGASCSGGVACACGVVGLVSLVWAIGLGYTVALSQ